jgi:hypothetical protein
MIHEADADGDGFVNYDGAHSSLSPQAHFLNIVSVTIVMQTSPRCVPFLFFLCVFANSSLSMQMI